VAPHAKVAQLVEHSTENAGVVGSIPSLGTFHAIKSPQVPLEAARGSYFPYKLLLTTATTTATKQK
jgi:hypothetical protein